MGEGTAPSHKGPFLNIVVLVSFPFPREKSLPRECRPGEWGWALIHQPRFPYIVSLVWTCVPPAIPLHPALAPTFPAFQVPFLPGCWDPVCVGGWLGGGKERFQGSQLTCGISSLPDASLWRKPHVLTRRNGSAFLGVLFSAVSAFVPPKCTTGSGPPVPSVLSSLSFWI